ncbi:MAG TPA: endonuclease domain-containing protein [Polyangiaceae bacterium]|jgi:very-short-patch-repair endonuclease|nr:endonuclease domain-containing protein [Polyangiaceae bacterium]
MRSRNEENQVRKQLRLEQCAWVNRRAMTPPELRLWSALRARQLGVQFRRQVPLAGRYIADFCAPAVRLVVEVDGAHHEQRRNADARRDAELRRLGYRVLRFEAELVMRELSLVVALVRAVL